VSGEQEEGVGEGGGEPEGGVGDSGAVPREWGRVGGATCDGDGGQREAVGEVLQEESEEAQQQQRHGKRSRWTVSVSESMTVKRSPCPGVGNETLDETIAMTRGCESSTSPGEGSQAWLDASSVRWATRGGGE
jgi:hypothetical protein